MLKLSASGCDAVATTRTTLKAPNPARARLSTRESKTRVVSWTDGDVASYQLTKLIASFKRVAAPNGQGAGHA
jgi:hypothetical protein